VTLTTRACVGLPGGYCVVVGFLFGALSPAIVVPSLLKVRSIVYKRTFSPIARFQHLIAWAPFN